MQICKLCDGEIPVPEGESVLKICKGCVKRDDLKGDDLAYQLRQKAVAKNPKVTVHKAKNVPAKVVQKPKPKPEPAPKVAPKAAAKKTAKKAKK